MTLPPETIALAFYYSALIVALYRITPTIEQAIESYRKSWPIPTTDTPMESDCE